MAAHPDSHYIIVCPGHIVKENLETYEAGMGNIFAFEGGVVVRECRIFIFTALFICLTAVKLCFPAVPAQVGQELSRVICGQADYGEAVQAMGRAIGRGKLVQVLNDLRPGTGGELISALGQDQERQTERPSPAPGPTLP